MLLVVCACSAVPGIAHVQSSFAAELLGVGLLRDADFDGNADWINNRSLPRQNIGGRIQVSFHNTGSAALQVNDVAINDRTFNQLTAQPTSGPEVADSKWWRVWPNPVPPGKVATITLRMVNLAADLPAGAAFEILTDRGNLRFAPPQFNPQPAPLRIVALNFSSDLNTTSLFVMNQGTANITLQSTGGFSINGNAEYTSGVTVPQTSLAPGDVVPIIVASTTRVLAVGEQAFFRVAAQSGEVAVAALRVLPYRFTVQSQMQGSGYDDLDRQTHYVGDWDGGARSLLDEPSGGGMTPMQVVGTVTDWLRAMDQPPDQRSAAAATRQRQAVEIHNTSYMEGLVYDDIADIVSTHWGNIRQDLSTYLTAPKPNWYMPQNSWGQNEGLYVRESWPSLEDLQFQAFQAVGRGAKSIQWFLYQNHWEQGWGRAGGTDFARTFQDKLRSGHIGNPLMWNRVGRVSGVLRLVEPYLTNSASYASAQVNGLGIDTLVSVNQQVAGTYKAVVTVMDDRTPKLIHTGYLFRYGVPSFSQQVLYYQTVQLRLPTYVYNAVSNAYSIDPFLGIGEPGLRKLGANQVELTLPEVQTGALIVLGNAADYAALRAAWSQVQASFAGYGDGRASHTARAQAVPQATWRFPEYTYRQRIMVTNRGSAAATTLELPLKLPIERGYRSSDFRSVEIKGGQATPMAFFVQGQQSYEAFATPDSVSRVSASCINSASPAGCSYHLEYVNGALALVSNVLREGFTWTAALENPQPWRATFPDNSIPARFSTVSVEARLGTSPFWASSAIVFRFDPDGNSTNQKGRGFQLRGDANVSYDLGNGWSRYIFDVQKVFNHPMLYPGQKLRGRYSIGFQTQVTPGSSLTGAYPWSIRRIELSGSDRIIVGPAIPLAPGETRIYEVYYDVPENGPNVPSPQFTPALATAISAPGLVATADAREVAGVAMRISGANVAITTQANAAALLLRHFGADGTLVATHAPALAGRTASATLTRPMRPADLLAIIPIQRSGEGQTFVFNASGGALTGNVPKASVKPAAWTAPFAALQTPGTTIFPFSMDMSPDGQYVALGLTRVSDDRRTSTGLLRLLDRSGKLVWEKSFAGRVFYVRFTPDSRSVYVAANLGTDDLSRYTLYTEAHILQYNLAGAERWRHKVGSGTPIPATQQGRTVFDMQVYPNGDVLYSEWNTYGVRLDKDSGQVVWAVDTGFGTTSYTSRVVPLRDGGAVLLGGYTKCVDSSGATRTTVFMNRESQFAAASAGDCSAWALSGNTVRIINRSGDLRIDNPGQPSYAGDGVYVGRYPRTMAFSPDGSRLAVGTTDGVFTLMDRSGKVLWQKRDSSSYVTSVAVLPGNAGVAFAREIFDYQHGNAVGTDGNGWRLRDVVEAYDLNGNPLWCHEGPWRTTEPFMTQFVIGANGTRLAVMSNTEVRYVDLTRPAVPNSYLYPVEGVPATIASCANTSGVYLPLVTHDTP
jgi:WD40 repeat protein